MRRIIGLTVLILGLATSASAQTYQGYGDPHQLVDHWYQTFLGRSAVADTNSYTWAEQLRQGSAPNAVLAGILSSDEYYSKGGRTPEGFIRNLFGDIVVRQPTPSELQYWMQRTVTQNPQDPRTRQDIAYDLLTTNPGSAQGSYVVPPPYLPGRERERDQRWEHERERWKEREREHHDYRRPAYPWRH